MGDPYVFMLIALAVLAVLDLVVGVSNDAVNFLNSAIGSKAIPIKTIMIIASVGVFFGAVSSSGMMEVARKGIFNPDMFVFKDIMIIFMAVMITDILLLDVFNSLGLPTSTTVSIVFELLGSAVIIALIKISEKGQAYTELWNYINHSEATKIIIGILLSVVIAFTVGAIVQYFSRLIYSFDFSKRPLYINALFGGFALSAITYFVFLKGLKGTPYSQSIVDILYSGDVSGQLQWINNFFGSTYETLQEALKEKKDFIKLTKDNEIGVTLRGFLEIYVFKVVAISVVIWTIVSTLIIKVFKKNIFILIIGFGTFSLAMAFAGNDLVNFIGVPIAALNSYESWSVSNQAAEVFAMSDLADKVPSNTLLLLLAGAIMVVTLWTSKKARSVIETGINLSRQGEGHEKFKPNNVSRVVVRMAMVANSGINFVIPNKTLSYLNEKFEKPTIAIPRDKNNQAPAFDLVRASVNLIVASILISIATSMKLPLSTTYVTFMVAMGASLADRAWGRESAVYRVAGVINVILGWFLTAFVAFIAAAFVASLIHSSFYFIIILLAAVAVLVTRTTIMHSRKVKEEKEQQYEERAELLSINGVIEESSDHISSVALRVGKLYNNVVSDLSAHDLNKLRKTDKNVAKLNNEIDELKDGVYYFIKSLEDDSVEASKFYILTLGHLQDVAQAIGFVGRASFRHVNNNHKNLKKGQLKDLAIINKQLNQLLKSISEAFESRSFDALENIIVEKRNLLDYVADSIDKQVTRIREEESSPKNTTLYFSILLETQDLISALMRMLELYQEFHLTTKDIREELK
jgi:phosphate/sulfate permease